MAFASKIRREFDKDSKKVEEVDRNEHSNEVSKDEEEIREAYNQLFNESLKIKKTNKVVFMKINELELEKERLIHSLQESNFYLSKLYSMNKSLEIKVKNLMSDLED